MSEFKESPEIKGIETQAPRSYRRLRYEFKESPEIKGIETNVRDAILIFLVYLRKALK